MKHIEKTTSFPALLEKTNTAEVNWGQEKNSKKCIRMAIIG
jgi:hypothetical protein